MGENWERQTILEPTQVGSVESDNLIQMGIINAYHLPGFGEEVFCETISPVNISRLIFNLYPVY